LTYNRQITIPIVLSIFLSSQESLSGLEVAQRIVDRFPPEKPDGKNAAVRAILSAVLNKLIVLAQAGYIKTGHRLVGEKGRSVVTFGITPAGIHFLSRK
jgi:hypothetical protein